MTDPTTVLIAAIESEPILYDRGRNDFKDLGRKRDVWSKVASKVGLTAQEAERRWRHVRDGFSKYRRRKLRAISGYGGQAVKEYKYARMLAFLNPFKTDLPTTSAWPEWNSKNDYSLLENDATFDSDAGHEQKPSDVAVKSEPDQELGTDMTTSTSELPTMATPADPFRTDDAVSGGSCHHEEGVVDPGQVCAPTETSLLGGLHQEDDLDLFMRSMAQTIRKLPTRQRAILKYQIHALVHKAEMEYFNDWSLS